MTGFADARDRMPNSGKFPWEKICANSANWRLLAKNFSAKVEVAFPITHVEETIREHFFSEILLLSNL